MKGEKINLEEAKKMVGTEFIYEFPGGDTVPAYVKMFDSEIGLTCLSLDTKTAEEWQPGKGHLALEEDGTFCVIGVDLKHGKERGFSTPHTLDRCFYYLREIKKNGKVQGISNSSGRDVSCAFS